MKTLVSMETDSFHRIIMEKTVVATPVDVLFYKDFFR